MKGTLVIAGRELTEKRFVLIAALAFAVLALLAPFFPGVHVPYSEVLTVSSGWLAIGFTLGLATILGVSTVGRELGDNRLSFYFSRPLSATAIWFGKLLGSAVLITGSFLIIGTPVLVTGVDAVIRSWIPSTYAFVGAVALASVVLFFVAHVLSTMVRSHSAWIALDFICFVLSIIAAGALLFVPLRATAVAIAGVAAIILAVGVAIVMFFSGAWQLAWGRTGPRANHIALSRFLWSGVALVWIAAAAYVWWGLTASPSDLLDIAAVQGGRGWGFVQGRVKYRGDYRQTFLISAGGRRSLRLALPPWWGCDISRDGSTAAWLRAESTTRILDQNGRIVFPADRASSYEVVISHLDRTDPRPESTGITTSVPGVSLSNDGTRILLGMKTFTIYDLASRRSMGSFKVDAPENAWTHACFTAPNVVRIFVMSWGSALEHSASVTMYEYDIASRALHLRGKAPGRLRSISPDCTRMLTEAGREWYLDDARTGALIANFGLDGRGDARLLPDGSVVMTDSTTGTLVVRHLSRDGVLLGEVSLGAYFMGRVSGGDGHREIVQLLNTRFEPLSLVLADLDRGVVEHVDPSLRRVVVSRDSLNGDFLCQTSTGIVAWNPSTGAKRLIAGQ